MYEYEYYIFYPVPVIDVGASQEVQTDSSTGKYNTDFLLNYQGYIIPLIILIVIVFIVKKLF